MAIWKAESTPNTSFRIPTSAIPIDLRRTLDQMELTVDVGARSAHGVAQSICFLDFRGCWRLRVANAGKPSWGIRIREPFGNGCVLVKYERTGTLLDRIPHEH